MGFIDVVETVGTVLDGTGVAIIAIGTVLAVRMALGRLIRKSTETYRILREQLGRSILLGGRSVQAVGAPRDDRNTASAGDITGPRCRIAGG